MLPIHERQTYGSNFGSAHRSMAVEPRRLHSRSRPHHQMPSSHFNQLPQRYVNCDKHFTLLVESNHKYSSSWLSRNLPWKACTGLSDKTVSFLPLILLKTTQLRQG